MNNQAPTPRPASAADIARFNARVSERFTARFTERFTSRFEPGYDKEVS